MNQALPATGSAPEPTHVTSPRSFSPTRTDAAALSAITLVVIAAAVIVRATDDVPAIDDWTYAWSVEHFLKAGELRVLDWSAHYPLAQIVWAALFGHLFGVSFSTLRLSTLVLEWIGLLAFFLTLRAVGLRVLLSLLGTLLLFFNPVMFVLAHSFMTDVPFVSVMNVTILCYVLWGIRQRPAYLCLGNIFAIISLLIRQIGVVLILIPIAHIVLSRTLGVRRRLSVREAVWLLWPVVAIALFNWWIRDVHGMTSVYRWRTEALYHSLSVSALLSAHSGWLYFRILVRTLLHPGLLLWPLALANLDGRSRRGLLLSLGCVVVVTVVYYWHFGDVHNPLEYGQTLSWDELGPARPLLSKEDIGRQIPVWATWAVLGVTLLAAVGILVAVLEHLRSASWRSGLGIIALNGVLQFLAIELVWLDWDRYYLPLLPPLIVLLVTAARWTIVTKTLAVGGLLMFAVVSLSGTIDHFRFIRTVAEARQWLLDQGIAPWQIDAGYALNGWWLYAHPENLAPEADPVSDVQSVTVDTKLPYRITNSPLPSYRVMRVLTWRRLWSVSDRIYVLQKTDLTATLTARERSAPAGATAGIAEISWSTGDGSVGQVYVTEDGGEASLFGRGITGHDRVFRLRQGAVYQFRLYRLPDRHKSVAEVTLTWKRD